MNPNCVFCGSRLANNARFCSHCGITVPSRSTYISLVDVRDAC